MNQILTIARKEMKSYFGSPMASIFIGTFLLTVLFSFFWVETFFARNIADIRPLFQWMPLLMIFLGASLTMRQWSEEQKMGTLEILLTLPVKISHLVLGKFLAVLALVAVALLLTTGLPVTVSLLGNIDWGPVIGGYLATMLMAGAYIAIGLFISSRTDNQIIALILTVLVGSLLYLIGSSGLTTFFGNQTGVILRSLGSGSRFLSIERGVIDLRDLLYYLSIIFFFLSLNILSLEAKGWSCGRNTASSRRHKVVAVILIAANLLAFNCWFARVGWARIDLTENREYSISQSTRDLISNLQEPLVLRGYFSSKTHPLLAPLVPRIKDLMSEYALASEGMVDVTFVDPRNDEQIEEEANQQFGIKPVPFQVEGRYESSVVNSYFNILVKYGDQYVVLGFNDIIEIQQKAGGAIDVGLRNLEYDLTKSIKKVVYGFQSLTQLFDTIQPDLKLVAIITPEKLPESLAGIDAMIVDVVHDMQRESNGKLSFELINPDQASISVEEIKERFDIEPIARSFFSTETFFLHLLLYVGDHVEQVYLSRQMENADIRKEIEAVIRRNGSGFMKTVGVWLPESIDPSASMYSPRQPLDNFQILQQVIRENYNLLNVDLDDGHVPAEVDVLMVVAPQKMTDLERFAIDQYLMKGGSVIVFAGNYLLDLNPSARSLNIKHVEQGLNEMLASYGIVVKDLLVMDNQNEPFPIPVTRNLGGFSIQEIQQLDYPFFVDVREDGMDKQSPIVANLSAVTLNWASPIEVDSSKNSDRAVVSLLQSSSDSWLTDRTDIQPDFSLYPASGFPAGKSFSPSVLAVSVQGSSGSFFAGKDDPRTSKPKDLEEESLLDAQSAPQILEGNSQIFLPLIKNSPESSRLIVVGCADFINDTVISISRSIGSERFLNSLEFVQNLIDWSVADEELLAIRSRGTHARILRPLSRQQQRFWEFLNYSIALLALVVIATFGAFKVRREQPMELV